MTAPAQALSEQDVARLTALKELIAARQAHGRVPTVLMAELASALDMSTRNLHLLLKQYEESGTCSKHQPRKRKNLPDENAAKNAYFFTAGDAHATYKILEGLKLTGGMDLRTFQRRVRQWPAWLRACAKGGYRAMIKHQMFNVEHLTYRTAIYGTDHTLLPIQVIPERGFQPVFVWLTIVMDLKTRVVLAWLLTTHTPTVEDSVAVLADAIEGWIDPERGYVGGKPEFLRTDRGGDFISDAMNRGLLRIDVQRQFTEPYASWQNGRVERLHGTIDREFAPTQPGYVAGGAEEYTRRVFRVEQPVASLGTLEDLDESFQTWFHTYNNRPHRSLNGLSPLEAWFSDPHPIQMADPTVIRSAMLRSVIRRVNRYGIDFRGRVYNSPSLGHSNCPVESRVEVRYHQHKTETVEVFLDGTWICTAIDTRKQSDEQKLAIVSRRAGQKREAARRLAIANYQRVVEERERQRARGVPEADLPPLPEDPIASADRASGQRRTTTNDDGDQPPAALTQPGTTSEFEALLTNVTDDLANTDEPDDLEESA